MIKKLFFACVILVLLSPFSFALPLEGFIQNNENETVAKVKIYHEYVEVFSLGNRFLARVGILSERGRINVFVSTQDTGTVVAYANMGIVYDLEDNWIASYAITPTYSYVFDAEGERLGRIKCLAWQRVCGLGAAVYLLKLLEP